MHQGNELLFSKGVLKIKDEGGTLQAWIIHHWKEILTEFQ